jgi:hypothetical protein
MMENGLRINSMGSELSTMKCQHYSKELTTSLISIMLTSNFHKKHTL